MKPLSATLFLTSVLGLAAGQDKLSKEDTEKYAKLCVEGFGKPLDVQIETQGDETRAVAVRGEGGGAMVVPDRGLTADKLAKVEKEVVPIGQLWLRKWTPIVGGRPVPTDKNRIVTVRADGQDRPMPVLLLGVRKKDQDREVVVYARDAEPILVLPLKKVEFVQEVPIDLEWEAGKKNLDKLTLTIFGAYRTIVPVTRQ